MKTILLNDRFTSWRIHCRAEDIVSWLAWGFFCEWVALLWWALHWLFHLSLTPQACALSSAHVLVPACPPISICSLCPHPGGKMAVANSLRVSFGLCLTALCESVLCWIDFQCIGFCLSALEPRRLALIATSLLCDFCIDLSVRITRKPSAILSWSQASRRKNCNNNCELLWPPWKERVR